MMDGGWRARASNGGGCLGRRGRSRAGPGCEAEVGGAGGPVDLQVEVVTVFEPEGDLFDGGVFEIGWQWGLAGEGSVPGSTYPPV